MTRDNRKSWRAESRTATAALSANQQQSLISAGMTAPSHTRTSIAKPNLAYPVYKMGQSNHSGDRKTLSGYMKTANKNKEI